MSDDEQQAPCQQEGSLLDYIAMLRDACTRDLDISQEDRDRLNAKLTRMEEEELDLGDIRTVKVSATPPHPPQFMSKTVDVDLVVNQTSLPRSMAREALRRCNGNVADALQSLQGDK